MTDSSSTSASRKTSSSSDSLKPPTTPLSNTTPTSTTTKQADTSWRDKFRKRNEDRGKERWRDASLSDQDRWKDWQKVKDKEQAKNSTAGFYTEQYKKKGSWGYWVDAFF
ncbi:Nn.00g035370.m01.CDS01 [Neocucurbitaria sp. VM-36]